MRNATHILLILRMPLHPTDPQDASGPEPLCAVTLVCPNPDDLLRGHLLFAMLFLLSIFVHLLSYLNVQVRVRVRVRVLPSPRLTLRLRLTSTLRPRLMPRLRQTRRFSQPLNSR